MNYKLIYWAIAFLVMCSCQKDNVDTSDTEEPDTEEPGENKREVLVWVDARSNVFGTYGRFSDKDEIIGVLDTLQDAGVTGLVIDVKGSSGYTMYPSAYTSEVTTRDGKTKPADY